MRPASFCSSSCRVLHLSRCCCQKRCAASTIYFLKAPVASGAVELRSPGSSTPRPRGTWSRSRCASSPATTPTAASSGISADDPSVGLSFSAQFLNVVGSRSGPLKQPLASLDPLASRPHSILALIEKANCNLIRRMRVSGFKMGDSGDDS